MAIEIKSTITPKIGFASHQNAVPVIRQLELINEGEQPYENLVLELTSDPPLFEIKIWRIDLIRGNSALHISDRDVKLNASFLSSLNEGVSGEVRFRLLQESEILASKEFPLEVLAINEWGGYGTMPELLAAFCMPNDPAIDHLLKGASDVLRRAGKKSGLNGYLDGSRTRVWELVSSIWSSVAGLGLSYALPPANFEEQGQKIRTPGSIRDGGVATCIDTALMFAATLEQAGLNALLVLTRGHAFAGVWLQPQEFSHLLTDEAAAIRKRIELHEILVFETTLITQSPTPAFSIAVEEAKRQLNDEDFLMVLDIHRARMLRIRPLSLLNTSSTQSVNSPESNVSDALEHAPELPSIEINIDSEPDTVVSKIVQWQRKLLDLTTRNRLLHLPETAKYIPLFCPDPAVLEDKLAGGNKIKILPLPDPKLADRDSEIYEQRTNERLNEQYGRAALERGEILSPLVKSKLEAEVVDLYRKTRTDLDEGGANTLFLALGFLRWKKSADDSKIYRAPLILLPVKLERRSALSDITMIMHEDEPRFNLTLLELLRQDFELNIKGLDGPLPLDESGIDVPLIWNIVRLAVKDIPGFEVVTDLVLGTFSFAKYLMWKDLVDRVEILKRNPVICHLLDRSAGSFESGTQLLRPVELDHKVNPSELFTPLPADSSQLAAIVTSANGGNFVLDGPPGTGKSQTIANMIAHNLALGKRVLFVAEKMAALNVVYRRLAQKGLADFCLEVHSNKTSKIEILKQLERAWDTRETLSKDEWEHEGAEVLRLRNGLNNIVNLLHQSHVNGLTLHQCIGRVVKDMSEGHPSLSWPKGTKHDEGAMTRFRDISHRLDLNYGSNLEVPEGFTGIVMSDWSNEWQNNITATAREIVKHLDVTLEAYKALLDSTSLPVQISQKEDIRYLSNFVSLILQTYALDLGFTFSPDFSEKVASGRKLINLLKEYRETEKSLSQTYAPESSRRLNVDEFEHAWQKAETKFWFLATLSKKKVARNLASQGGVTGLPNPRNDFPKLRRMRVILEEMDSGASKVTEIPGWLNLSSDTEKMELAIALAENLRSYIGVLSTTVEQGTQLRTATRALIIDANDLLMPGGTVSLSTAKLILTFSNFTQVAENFRRLCESDVEKRTGFSELRSTAEAIGKTPNKLKAWCDWQRVRKEAIDVGLLPLVEALESGSVLPGNALSAFETAYAKWFASEVMDSESLLRAFVPAEHMSNIEAYRKLEDRLSELSVRYIRAKLCGNIPSKNEVTRKDGFGILKHELQKQRRHKPLRQLAIEMGDALTQLAPCMLMSPLSIAQYLPPEQSLFDLVIFDEASQIAPWDAIGSIGRGKQVVIAGDPRQMPPTNFFNRGTTLGDGDGDGEEDMESILDECLASGIPQIALTWHYRSRHESLIAFSNHRYYDGMLITFPAAVTKKSAVEHRQVEGIYAKGVGRTNQIEAEAMVAEAVKRLLSPTFTSAEYSLAIVTLNAEQQKLVEDLLDQARKREPQIERFFSHDIPEPVVVKNLETVQGDERDLIILGIGYGPTEPGSKAMSMNFGPLNRDGGWRRLNVAVSRARREMLVFTSFDSSMIDLNRTSARAVADLKQFLEFADRGPIALAQAIKGSMGGYESPFEEAVAQGLMNLGWNVVPQIGVSSYRIDLGIVHPDRPGDYLVGVECDGAMYHSAATARDRDKIRASVLESLGWNLLRIWSTEWWIDKQGALARLDAKLRNHLEKSKAANEKVDPS